MASAAATPCCQFQFLSLHKRSLSAPRGSSQLIVALAAVDPGQEPRPVWQATFGQPWQQGWRPVASARCPEVHVNAVTYHDRAEA